MREAVGRDSDPSGAIVDSRSTYATGFGREQGGFGAGKKVRGRERRILMDAEGVMVLEVTRLSSLLWVDAATAPGGGRCRR